MWLLREKLSEWDILHRVDSLISLVYTQKRAIIFDHIQDP